MPKRGFTIIELMITISIISLLIAAAVIGFAKARKTGRDSQRITDVLAIAQAVDQSALLQRGVYLTGSGNRILANTISTTDSNGKPLIDASIFRNDTIPTDPNPATPAPCTVVTFLCGYTYNNRVGNGSLARTLTTGQYEYVLEVGLEGDRFSDEQSMTAGPAGTISNRTQYLYLGKYCGPTSVNNSCSIQ